MEAIDLFQAIMIPIQDVYNTFLKTIMENSKLKNVFYVIPKEDLIKIKKAGGLSGVQKIYYESKEQAKKEIKTNLVI